MKLEPYVCSICHEQSNGYGNNAWPINDSRCCDFCNTTVVIPARIRSMTRKQQETKQ